MNGITSKSVLLDQLKPDAGAKLVKLLADDNERARKAKEARRRRKAAKGEQPPGD